jgi:hypothetical protein
MIDRTETLERLTGTVLNVDGATNLIETCSRLRRKPIGELSTEDLRLLIGQQFDLEILVPEALEILEANPFAMGDFYCGDLLMNVLSIDRTFWKRHTDLYSRVLDLVGYIRDPLVLLQQAIRDFEGGSEDSL